MSDITVSANGLTVEVISPYDPVFVSRAKDIGGRWNPASKAWTFDVRDKERVRELLREVYGTDGTDTVDEGAVTVRVPIPEDHQGAEFRVAGRRLAYRPGRDARVVLAAGVVLAEGGFDVRGGSINRPRLDASEGTVLEVRDVPRSVADQMVSEVHATIVETPDEHRAALVAERTRLVARLAEIDAALG